MKKAVESSPSWVPRLKESSHSAPAVGWVCSAVPEEILIAAGVVPRRLYGYESRGEESEAVLPTTFCAYTHGVLQAALRGEFGSLAAVILVNSCDAMRRLADIWERHVTAPPVYRLDFPFCFTSAAEDYWVGILKKLVTFLEELNNRRVTDENLRKAILLMNETRRRIWALDQRRAKSIRGMPGRVYAQWLVKAFVEDKATFLEETESVLRHDDLRCRRRDKGASISFLPGKMLLDKEEASLQIFPSVRGAGSGMSVDSSDDHENACRRGPRVVLGGCAAELQHLAEIVETKCGSRVVADTLCTGTRHFNTLVPETEDPLRAIAWRYLHRAPCARRIDGSGFVDHIRKRVEETQADGVVFATLKFCDMVRWRLHGLAETMAQENIPFLHVERDGSAASWGQMETRVQAFVEMIGTRRCAGKLAKDAEDARC